MLRFIARRGLVLAALFAGCQCARVFAAPVYFEGTGHWYEAVRVPGGVTWGEAYTNAVNRGGYLCTVTNAGENSFVGSLVDISFYSDLSVNNDILGPWLGGLRHANESNWQWVTGEPFTYSNWYPNQPDGYGGSEQRLQYYNRATIGVTWGDHPGNPISGYSLPRGYIVEYEQAARLSVAFSNNVAVVFWPRLLTDWVLESRPDIAGGSISWSEVPVPTYQTNATSLFIAVTNPSVKAFYRLRK